MSKKITFEEFTLKLKNINPDIQILDTGYKDNKTNVKCKCLIDGHIWFASPYHLTRRDGKNTKCPKCYGNVKLTLEKVKDMLSLISPNIEIIESDYKNANTKMKCRCKIDGYEWNASWADLSGKTPRRCPMCSGKVVGENNSIIKNRPDIIPFLKNTEDAFNYSIGSMKKIWFRCPDCGHEKLMSINTVSNNGMACNICSDGVSIPNKFVLNLLTQININFKSEKIFTWSKNKKYDFYIPSLNMIIEAHGEQHYIQRRKSKRTLKEEQENDVLKEKLAKENGIEHYIVIDCRNSEYAWLKENCIKELSNILELKNVYWNTIWELCQKSMTKLAWELWNDSNSVKDISKKLNLHTGTISRYLNVGRSVGRCTYTGNKKEVNQYDKDMNFVNKYKSVSEAYAKTGFSVGNISNCCNGKLKSVGGFIWKYK